MRNPILLLTILFLCLVSTSCVPNGTIEQTETFGFDPPSEEGEEEVDPND